MGRDEYLKRIAQLRYKDKNGTWYQVNPEDGEWLRWDGHAWRKLEPRKPEQPQAQTRAADMPAEPLPPDYFSRDSSFFEILVYILRMTWSRFRKRIPLAILLAIGMTAFYFYAQVVKNNGYNYEPLNSGGASIGYRVLGVGSGFWGTGLNGGIVLMVLLPLLFGILKNIFKVGPVGAITELFLMPVRIGGYFARGGPVAYSGLASAAGLAIILASALNGYASLALALGFGGVLMSGGRQVLSILIRSAWESTYGLAKGKRGSDFPLEAGYVAMFGSSLGFLAGSFIAAARRMPGLQDAIPASTGMVIGIGLLILAFIIAQTSRERRISMTALLLSFAYLVYRYLAMASGAYADDTGLAEEGGNWQTWLAHGNAPIAGAAAAAAGLGSGIGGLLGTAINRVLQESLQTGTNEPTMTGTGNRILSGTRAIRWMMQQGLIKNGILTNNFWAGWYDRLGDDGNPLRAILGNFDPYKRDHPITDMMIVITDPNAVTQPAAPADTSDSGDSGGGDLLGVKPGDDTTPQDGPGYDDLPGQRPPVEPPEPPPVEPPVKPPIEPPVKPPPPPVEPPVVPPEPPPVQEPPPVPPVVPPPPQQPPVQPPPEPPDRDTDSGTTPNDATAGEPGFGGLLGIDPLNDNNLHTAVDALRNLPIDGEIVRLGCPESRLAASTHFSPFGIITDVLYDAQVRGGFIKPDAPPKPAPTPPSQEPEIKITKDDLPGQLIQPGDKRPFGMGNLQMSILVADPNKTNAEKVDFLVKESLRIRGCNTAATFWRTYGGVAGSSGSTLVERGLTTASGEFGAHAVPDGPGFTQMLTHPGPLNNLYDKLSQSRGMSRMMDPFPASRAEVDAAIAQARKSGNADEVRVLQDIKKLFNGLGGKNVKIQ